MPLHKKLLLLADILILLFVVSIVTICYFYVIPGKYSEFYENIFVNLLALIIILILLFHYNNQYKYQVILNKQTHFVNILKSITFGFIILIFIAFLFKSEGVWGERLFWLLLYINILIISIFTRVFLVPFIYYRIVSMGIVKRNVIIIGAGGCGKNILKLLRNKSSYFKVVGFLDDDINKQGKLIDDIQVNGGISTICDYINIVDDIFIAINNIEYPELQKIINQCRIINKTIHIASNLYNIVSEKIEIEMICGSTFFRINPKTASAYYDIFKRFVDIVVSIIIISLLSPLFIFISLLIKLGAQGPVIYKSTVIGKNTKPFIWYKFRSMVVNHNHESHKKLVEKIIIKEQSGQKLIADDRITWIGKYLRKYSFDEFPQLINVLKGEMSLVGPRPKLQYEFELMKNWQKHRFSVLPGMTGIWQIRGRNEVKFVDEIVLDLYYVESKSLMMDIKILLQTIPVIISGKTGK